LPNEVVVIDRPWNEWQSHLATRPTATPAQRLFQCSLKKALAWGLSRRSDRRLLAQRLARNGLATLAVSDTTPPPDCEEGGWLAAIESIAMAWQWPRLARHSSRDWWVAGLTRLLPGSQPSESPASTDTAPWSVWIQHLTRIERPIVLAHALPELAAVRAAAVRALEFWRGERVRWLDDENWLASSLLPTLPLLLACWTRTLAVARHVHGLPVDPSLADSHARLTELALRLARGDGGLMLVGDWPVADDLPAGHALVKGLAATSLGLMADKALRTQLVRVAGRIRLGRKRREKPRLVPSLVSEAARLAVLRTDWSAAAPRVAVAWPDDQWLWELARGIRLLAATDMPQVTFDGRPAAPSGPWQVNIAHSDEDVEFVEWELPLEGGAVVQRHAALVIDDGILLMADMIGAPNDCLIGYRQSWRLGDSLTWLAESETREVYLCREGEPCGLVLPLGLGEWIAPHESDRLAFQGERLELTQSARGRGLYAPLLIAPHKRYARQPRTWRRLTVGENLRAVPADQAQAFRARIGNRQWLLYRSLGTRGNRTFLGQNVSCELYLGRLTPRGKVDDLLTIDPVSDEDSIGA
jgi:hypothetical protein